MIQENFTLSAIRISKGIYEVRYPDGYSFLVEAPSKAQALITYLQRQWMLSIAAKDRMIKEQREIAAVVCRAIREGGRTGIPEADPALPYIDVAHTLGFAARSHSDHETGRKWLMVAEDETGLNAIKGKIDRSQPKSPAR